MRNNSDKSHQLCVNAIFQDFLNGVCTSIMHMDLRKLKIYGGNYDQFIKTRSEQVEAQMKQYNWEQEQIAHMKEYIARFVSV